jgi:hypothetical protein
LASSRITASLADVGVQSSKARLANGTVQYRLVSQLSGTSDPTNDRISAMHR